MEFFRRPKLPGPQASYISVKPAPITWNLCPAAEPKLKTAIGEREFIVVNETFLVKFRGILAGVAVVDGTVNGERIDYGRCYRPIDPKVREMLREAFIRGEARITIGE